MKLSDISLVTANFGYRDTFVQVLEDWQRFLGGRPGEIIVVDCSPPDTQKMMFESLQAGQFDKLQLLSSDLPENGKHFCYHREHLCAASSTKPYVLWWKPDTLPYHIGHDDWLQQAGQLLDEPDVFCMSGSFNKSVKTSARDPQWYRSQHASINFCLMKRKQFSAAMQFFAGEYINSGFCDENPGDEHGVGRFLIEAAFRAYMIEKGLHTLTRVEDDSWSVFHTNVPSDRMASVREDYYARKRVRPYYNARQFTVVDGGCYYGQFLGGRIHEWKCRFGRQRMKQRLSSMLGRASIRSPLTE